MPDSGAQSQLYSLQLARFIQHWHTFDSYLNGTESFKEKIIFSISWSNYLYFQTVQTAIDEVCIILERYLWNTLCRTVGPELSGADSSVDGEVR